MSNANDINIAKHMLAGPETPVLLMVSGGSDSTALAYMAHDLAAAGELGPLAMLHVNHCLRGADSDGDEFFVQKLAQLLEIPLFNCRIDIAGMAAAEGGNVEAIARRERYAAARDALKSLCAHVGVPLAQGRAFTAHTADDRVETFYMRSIVGTGPGGFRSIDYANDHLVAPSLLVRPLLGTGREDLRDYLKQRASSGAPVVRDKSGALWRDDATNESTDQFRAYVRHNMVPAAKERNPRFLETLGRSMDLIADEDDMLQDMAKALVSEHVQTDADGRLLLPELGKQPVPLIRRAIVCVLQQLLPEGARVEQASVEAVLAAWENAGSPEAKPQGGYVTNIQGNLAVSANKNGVRIEPMQAFRARRKKN